jgi:hypothetical protein
MSVRFFFENALKELAGNLNKIFFLTMHKYTSTFKASEL